MLTAAFMCPTERTPLAGSSAGSLIAACYHSGLTAKTVTEACLVLADDCRVNGTRGRLGEVLSTFLHDLLPEDAHERCRNKTFVSPHIRCHYARVLQLLFRQY